MEKEGRTEKEKKNEEADDDKRDLTYKEDGQEYAKVLSMLGNGRCYAKCIDGVTRLCHIRGKLHKKVWINAGDIVLVEFRDYETEDKKADVILRFMPDEARLLKANGQLLRDILLNEGIAGEEEYEGNVVDDYLDFGDDEFRSL